MPETRKKAVRGFTVTLFALFFLAIFFFLNFKTVVVNGTSMEKTYFQGDRLLASKAYWLIGPIQRKDVIVIKDPQNPTSYIIKRVLALEGDVVDFENVPSDWKLSQGEYRVRKGAIYVIGDNRLVSEDSRRFGPVDASDVLGKIVHVDSPNYGFSVMIVLGTILAFALVWSVVRLVRSK